MMNRLVYNTRAYNYVAYMLCYTTFRFNIDVFNILIILHLLSSALLMQCSAVINCFVGLYVRACALLYRARDIGMCTYNLVSRSVLGPAGLESSHDTYGVTYM